MHYKRLAIYTFGTLALLFAADTASAADNALTESEKRAGWKML
ncbi:MAG: hypothetical protein JWN70_4235, partial [Planctomycetaceae bacterium]|nr:hypothetical protein [Planctomycetaceae bacterium]